MINRINIAFRPNKKVNRKKKWFINFFIGPYIGSKFISCIYYIKTEVSVL